MTHKLPRRVHMRDERTRAPSPVRPSEHIWVEKAPQPGCYYVYHRTEGEEPFSRYWRPGRRLARKMYFYLLRDSLARGLSIDDGKVD